MLKINIEILIFYINVYFIINIKATFWYQDKSVFTMYFKVFLVLSIIHLINSYKILFVIPHKGKSHTAPLHSLAEGLLEKGHEVTMLTHFHLNTSNWNYTEIPLTEYNYDSFLDITTFKRFSTMNWLNLSMLNQFSITACEKYYTSHAVKNFLDRCNTKFDVIIILMFSNDCYLSFVHKFKAPIIGFCSSTIFHWLNQRFGNPTHPAYIPNIMMPYSDKLTFWQRTVNLIAGIYENFYYENFILSIGEKNVKKYFGYNSSLIKDLVLNMDLLFMNSHFSLSLPRPLVPKIVEVGGIHVTKEQRLTDVSYIILSFNNLFKNVYNQ